MVPLRKKVLKYGTPKPRIKGLGFPKDLPIIDSENRAQSTRRTESPNLKI